MVGHCIRFSPPCETAKDLVRNGEIGDVLTANFSRRSAMPKWAQWLGDESQSGGAILDLGVHDIDFAQQLFGHLNESVPPECGPLVMESIVAARQ